MAALVSRRIYRDSPPMNPEINQKSDPQQSFDTAQRIVPESPIHSLVKRGVAVVLAAISFVYILNPGAGILEIIPDNIPLIGNFDEAFFVAVFFSCMAYLGVDLRPFKKFFDIAKGKRNETGDKL